MKGEAYFNSQPMQPITGLRIDFGHAACASTLESSTAEEFCS
jgi:hypothetical protein